MVGYDRLASLFKGKLSKLRTGVFFSRQDHRPGACMKQRAMAAEKGKTRPRLLVA